MTMLTTRGERTSTVQDSFGQVRAVARVNLLPQEILDARTFRRTQGLLAACVLAVVAVAGGAYALAAHSRDGAQQQVAASQATGTTLTREQAKYADVPRVYNAIETAQTTRQTAMAQDVEWYRYLTDLSLTVPDNVWVTSLAVSLSGTTSAAGAAPAAATTNPLSTPGVGTITVAGKGKSHNDVAAWLDSLGQSKGVADPYFSNSTSATVGKTPIVTFNSTATLTETSLSHRFDRKAG
jgi:Tfp pilus assembly protein PilN